MKMSETPMKTSEPELDPETTAANLLCEKYVKYPSGHWKGPAVATVPADMADAVSYAMGFFGSLVDTRKVLPSGMVELSSRGYWAHGF